MNHIPKEIPEAYDLYKRVQNSLNQSDRKWLNKPITSRGGLCDHYAVRKWPNSDKLQVNEEQVVKYLFGTISLEEMGITPFNARQFLQITKIVDLALKPIEKTRQSSYPLRKHILQLCSPEMTSCQAYTLTVDPEKMGDIDYLCQPENWVSEEVGHQAKAIAALFTEMVGLARENPAPVFYAIRGNTGSGKSTYLYELFHTHSGFLSLDPLKAFLKRNVKLTNVQVYEEANALFANYLNGIFKQKALRFIFDSRLLAVDYIQKHVLSPAIERGEEVKFIDLDVPLFTSLVRSLSRDPYGKEACVPSDAIARGFLQIRKERAALISLMKNNPQVTSYKLYQDTTLVAEKKADGFYIYNQEKYEECLRLPSEEEIKACLDTVIDSPSLSKWVGKSIGAALDAHAFQFVEKASLIPPDKVRFEVPCMDILKIKYEDFYKKRAIKSIQDAIRNRTTWKMSPDGYTIYPDNLAHYTPWNYPTYTVPIVLRDEEDLRVISISVRVRFLSSSDNLIALASEHENPIRFLLDHYEFWFHAFYPHEVYFLENHLTCYGVLDTFEMILENGIHKEAVFEVLGNAWPMPRAKELLIKYAGLTQLAPHLADESIQESFHEIVRSFPDYKKRLEALNYLENDPLNALDTEICGQILSSISLEESPDDFEGVLWNMPENGYAALSALGGRKITAQVCELLLKCDTDQNIDAFNSILKYIAIKTQDQEEFDQVVETLIALDKRGFKIFHPLDVLLAEFKYYNPQRFRVPEGIKISDKVHRRGDKPSSALPCYGLVDLDEEEEPEDTGQKGYKDYLENTIRNSGLPLNKRVAALRKISMDLFDKYSHPKSRATAKSAIEALLSDPATPEQLCKEALRIRGWHEEFTH